MGAIYLIRHGQASFGKADYDQLSEKGWRQAALLGAALNARLRQVDAAYSGTLARHRQTADECLQNARFPLTLQADARFNEFDHDEIIIRHKPLYKNRLLMMADLAKTLNPRREFQAMFADAVERWVSGAHDAEYTETWPAFRARCVAAVQTLIADLGRSKTALVFTSGGPITAICQHLLQLPDEHAFRLNWTLTNCGVTKLIYGERGLYLSTLNEHSHFEGEHQSLITYR